MAWCCCAGDRDWMYHPQVDQIVQANRAHVAEHTIPGAGHHVYLDQPALFNDRVLQAIAAATPAPR